MITNTAPGKATQQHCEWLRPRGVEGCIIQVPPVNAFTTGNPFLGTKLLGFSIGRGSGALKGLSCATQRWW